MSEWIDDYTRARATGASITKTDHLIDEMAKAAYLLPRRQAVAKIFRLLGTAALGAVFVQRATAALSCGSNSGQSASNVMTGTCSGGTYTGSGGFTCPSNCPTAVVTSGSCTGGHNGNGSCSQGPACDITNATVKCSCSASTCGANQCCCTTNGTCQPSAANGGTGNCRAGFTGC